MPEPTPLPLLDDERTQTRKRHCAILEQLIAHGMALAADICAPPEQPRTDAAKVALADAHDRVTRSIRRSMLLIDKLAEPAPLAASRTAIRKRIIREVQDAIHTKADSDSAEGLRLELIERLELAELEDELATRSPEAIIQDLCRDLTLIPIPNVKPGSQRFHRRTPPDILKLCALAAAPAAPPGTLGPTTQARFAGKFDP